MKLSELQEEVAELMEKSEENERFTLADEGELTRMVFDTVNDISQFQLEEKSKKDVEDNTALIVYAAAEAVVLLAGIAEMRDDDLETYVSQYVATTKAQVTQGGED